MDFNFIYKLVLFIILFSAPATCVGVLCFIETIRNKEESIWNKIQSFIFILLSLISLILMFLFSSYFETYQKNISIENVQRDIDK